jgi:hypothetical protein
MLATEIMEEIDKVRSRMVELREQLSRYKGTGLDPVLVKFLAERFGFNYAMEAKVLTDDHEKANRELADLTVKVEHLSRDLDWANLQRRIKEAGITFHGQTFVKSEGSVVTCVCKNCKTEFSCDVSGTLGFQQVLNADTLEKWRFVVGAGANEFHAMCPTSGCYQDARLMVDRANFQG